MIVIANKAKVDTGIIWLNVSSAPVLLLLLKKTSKESAIDANPVICSANGNDNDLPVNIYPVNRKIIPPTPNMANKPPCGRANSKYCR